MKVDCYLLHIYCDVGESCVCKMDGSGYNEEFTGKNRTEVIRNAKAHGWITGRRDYCPMCVAAARKNDGKTAND